MASTIFVIIAVAFASSLATGLRTYQTARARTLAQLLGTQQIEEARRIDYDDLGVILGNPPGLLESTRTVDVDGYQFVVKTSVGYVDDPLPNGFQTSANYKLVTVTVSSPTSGTAFAELVTKVAPPTQPSLNKAVAEIQVVDDSNQPISGVVVDLDNGPSSNRFAVTDDDGWVVFPGLDPNPATGPQARYDVSVEVEGFVLHPDDAYKASLQLNPSQRLRTGVRVIRPVTATVSLVDAASVPFTANASVQISWDSGQQRSVVPVTAGAATISQVGGVGLAPNRDYTLSAYTAYTGYPATAWFSAAVTALVPDSYPDDLDTAFTLQLAQYTVSNLQVRVRESSYPYKWIAGARVVIEGGPAAVSLGGLTPGSAAYLGTYLPLSGASSYTVRVIAAGYNSTQTTVTLPAGGKQVTFNLTKTPG